MADLAVLALGAVDVPVCGTLTPTLKVKRRVVEKKYAPLIEAMYGEKSEEGSGENGGGRVNDDRQEPPERV